MARWDNPGVPHKGWTLICVEDLGEDVSGDEEIEYETCEMCHNERIRYVHILTHPEYPGEIRVGCDCACKMTEDYETLYRENEGTVTACQRIRIPVQARAERCSSLPDPASSREDEGKA